MMKSGYKKYIKKGRHAQKNKFTPSGEWELLESDDYSETYVHRGVLNELKNLKGDEVPHDVRFHATTSQVMMAIPKDGALVCSSEILNNGKSLINGERMYSKRGHPNVFVDPDQILWSYGRPRWFDQFGVAFGVSIEDQKKYLEQLGERVEYAGSDGFEIGSKVPMENIKVISAPASHLDEVKTWASVNCPGAKVISREVMKLKFRK